MEIKEIFDKRLALLLRDKGNSIWDCYVNKKKNGYVVYQFIVTEKFTKDLYQICEERNKKH